MVLESLEQHDHPANPPISSELQSHQELSQQEQQQPQLQRQLEAEQEHPHQPELTPPKGTLARLKERRHQFRQNHQLTPLEHSPRQSNEHQQSQQQQQGEQERLLPEVASAPNFGSRRSPLKLRKRHPMPPAAPSGIPFRRTRFRNGRETLESLQPISPTNAQHKVGESPVKHAVIGPTGDGLLLPPLKVPYSGAQDNGSDVALSSQSPDGKQKSRVRIRKPLYKRLEERYRREQSLLERQKREQMKEERRHFQHKPTKEELIKHAQELDQLREQRRYRQPPPISTSPTGQQATSHTPQFSTPPRQNDHPKELNQLLHQVHVNIKRTPRMKPLVDVNIDIKPPQPASGTPKNIRTPKPRKLQENWVSECLSIDSEEEELIARYETGFLNLMVSEPMIAEENSMPADF